MQSIDWSEVLKYTGITAAVVFGIILGITLLFLPLLVARALGSIETKDFFFKTVEEGRARAVMINGQFYKMIMSFNGHRFRRRVINDQPSSYWDIIPGIEWMTRIINAIPIFGKLIGGLKWIGIWPFAQIHRYNFAWISWEYPKEATGTAVRVTSSNKAPVPHSERVGHILVQDDVYFIKIVEAELVSANPDTSIGGAEPEFEPGIPVDLEFLLTIAVMNPYKALFAPQNWLELVTNQFEAFIRQAIGKMRFTDIFGSDRTNAENLALAFEQEVIRMEDEYGVRIKTIQLQSVQPGGPQAAKYRELSTEVYAATQKAKARKIKAEADHTYLEETVGYAAANPERLAAYKWLQLPESNLTTLIEGGAPPVGITLPPTTPPAPRP